MKLVACREDGGKTWFILDDKTEAEKQAEHVMKTLNQNSSDVQDCMMALAEMFEMMSGNA